MKILEKGDWHAVWTCEITCKHCGDKLEVEEKDVVASSSFQNAYFYVTCITCKTNHTLDSGRISERVRRDAIARVPVHFPER